MTQHAPPFHYRAEKGAVTPPEMTTISITIQIVAVASFSTTGAFLHDREDNGMLALAREMGEVSELAVDAGEMYVVRGPRSHHAAKKRSFWGATMIPFGWVGKYHTPLLVIGFSFFFLVLGSWGPRTPQSLHLAPQA